MAAEAGERVKESGDFYCTKCSAKVHLTKGERIPYCPQGHHEFESATERSARQS
jgi:hypothetical protein